MKFIGCHFFKWLIKLNLLNISLIYQKEHRFLQAALLLAALRSVHWAAAQVQIHEWKWVWALTSYSSPTISHMTLIKDVKARIAASFKRPEVNLQLKNETMTRTKLQPLLPGSADRSDSLHFSVVCKSNASCDYRYNIQHIWNDRMDSTVKNNQVTFP